MLDPCLSQPAAPTRVVRPKSPCPALRENSSHRQAAAIPPLTAGIPPFLSRCRCLLSAVWEPSRQGPRFCGALLLAKAVLATHLPANGRCALGSSQQSCQSLGHAVPNPLMECWDGVFGCRTCHQRVRQLRARLPGWYHRVPLPQIAEDLTREVLPPRSPAGDDGGLGWVAGEHGAYVSRLLPKEVAAKAIRIPANIPR